ncbi:DUF2332 domain-containing protein [Nocardioides speluncae]|uniref:DUF2332 domain-containing protein n=1 Tax=Nocardioides speluncae TaxID=2670337 RepID=UPI000D69DB02|nr:DUF2332 domain-containing protein [Nocardioides speluncae]
MRIYDDIVSQYADFATYSAGYSDCFAQWCAGVAGDAEVQAWIATLPPLKQQPNIVFAAARWHGVPAPAPYDALRDALLADDGTIRATILERRTQTNEVGRLANLAPVFAMIDGPVALLEVGASAGLCLYPDRYSYDWTPLGGLAGPPDSPTLPCQVDGPMPVPAGLPKVAWRGGIDLNPLDVHDEDAMAWLTTLVFPEQEWRRERLRVAVEVARAEPPAIRKGNLLDELPRLLEEIRGYGTPLVFHTAVIAYLEPEDRRRFHAMMTAHVADGSCHWVSNESPLVLPELRPPGESMHPRFVLALDGRPLAWTEGHGGAMTWLP